MVEELSNRALLFDENHGIAADLPSESVLQDIDLLKKVNLVDEYYALRLQSQAIDT